jgi:hypothetical protein
MRTVTVHRISLQFDTNRKGTLKYIVTRSLDDFSDALKMAFPDAQPQLILDSEEFDAERDVTIERFEP